MKAKAEARQRFRVVLLLGNRGTGLRDFLRTALDSERPYDIVGAVTTSPSSAAIPVLEMSRIPWISHPIREFYREKEARLHDLGVRAEFDRKTLELLEPFQPTVLALYGYLFILTPVVLDAFPSRVVNLHDGDLTISDPSGKPRYRGLHSVLEAVSGGAATTLSTAHLASEEVDCGPILCHSRPYPIHLELVHRARELGAAETLRAYAFAHREWMIQDGWPSLLDSALTKLWAFPEAQAPVKRLAAAPPPPALQEANAP